MNANWSYPTAIRFGAGRISELAEACQSVNIRKPLFVTDSGLAKLPITAAAIAVLSDAGLNVEVFSGVRSNPYESDVLMGVERYRSSGCDGVVAFGGGSALDVGKSIAFMQGQTRPIWDFEDIGSYWTRADADRIAPVIAVPTTAGTGSEVGRAAVVTKEDTREKKIIFHPRMLPVLVISDPALTVGLPPSLTAGAGMDALAHCVEAYCAPTFHPMSAGIALEGMRLIATSLERAAADGSDLDARSKMMAAASMGAVAFQKGLGAIHSLSHPVGAMYDTHHGMTNGVFMPYVLTYNRAAIADRIEPICGALGISDSFDDLMDWVLKLRRNIGVPHTLVELGVPADDIDEVAERAVADPSTGTNPRTLDVAGARAIFAAALEGTVAF